MIRLTVFDMAGTTVDNAFSVHDAMIRAFAQFKLTIDRELANLVIAVPKPVGIHHVLNKLGIVQPDLEPQLLSAFKSEMGHYYAYDPDVQEVPGTSTVFRALKGLGIIVGLDTGFDREMADIILSRMNWQTEGLVDFTITSDEVSSGRPHPEMIHRLMDFSGIQRADQVVKVGDTPADITQGRRAQCASVIGRLSGAFSREALLNAGADAVVSDIRDVLPIIYEAHEDVG